MMEPSYADILGKSVTSRDYRKCQETLVARACSVLASLSNIQEANVAKPE